MSSVPGTVEEIKVLISADSGKLTRELSSAEKAVLKARGVIQSASGGISGSSKAWTAYRTAAVTEMNRALEGVRKAQEKIAAIRSEIQATTFSDVEVESTIQNMLRNGTPDSQIASTVDAMQTPSPALQGQYAEAMAELQKYRDAAKEAGDSVAWLNQKVSESQAAEQSQVAAAKEAALRAKEQARAARDAALAHTKGSKSASSMGAGLLRLGKASLFALLGAATLYAILRKLITAFIETAKTDAQLSASLGQIKGNLAIAFQPIYQAALPALRALMSMLVTVTNIIAQFTVMLFGNSWGAASKGALDYAKSVGAAGGAAKAAASNMMAIDELNVMQANSGGGGGGGGIASIFGDPTELTAGWKAFFDDALYASERIKGLWEVIKESANQAWEDRKIELLSTIETITSNILITVGDIAEAWGNAWKEDDAGYRTFSALFGIVTAILGVVEDITGAIKSWAESTNLAPVTGAFAFLWEAIERLIKSIRDALRPIWDAFFGPTMDLSIGVAGTMAAALGMVIDIISMLINIVGAAVQVVSSGFTFIYDVLHGVPIADAWSKMNDNISEGFLRFKQNLDESAASFSDGMKLVGENVISSMGYGFLLGKPTAISSAEEVSTALEEKLALKNNRAIEAGKEYVDGITSGIDSASDSVQATATKTSEALTNALADTPTVEAAKQLGADLMAGLSQGIAENQALATTAMTDAMTAVTTAFQESMTTAVGSVDLASESTYQAYTDLGKTCADRFSEGFKSKLVDIAAETISDIQLRFQNMMTQLHYDLYNLTVAIMGDTRAMVLYINDWLGKITSKVTITLEFIMSGLGGGIDLGVTPGTGESGFGSTKPTLVLVPQMAASGGVFSSGQLIYAREAGPEIIGSLGGGRTGIMNNNQIVDSVSNGVYQAVVDAMATQSGDKGDFVVNVDGHELIRVTRSAERSSGYQISGNPTFAR